MPLTHNEKMMFIDLAPFMQNENCKINTRTILDLISLADKYDYDLEIENEKIKMTNLRDTEEINYFTTNEFIEFCINILENKLNDNLKINKQYSEIIKKWQSVL